jgi:hypothetical protein
MNVSACFFPVRPCDSVGHAATFPVFGRPTPSSAPREPAGRPRPDVIHSSLYLPEPVYEALRETAFHERRKIHDIIMEGIDLALRKRKYPSVEDLKAGKKQ